MIQRRAVESFLFFPILLIALSLIGCGGGSSSKVGPATTITITPTSASVEFGKFVTLVAAAKDASGKTVDPATITWSSSNTAAATVTASGANGSVCAGTWDSLTTPTVCTPTTTQASVTITAKSGNASASAVVNVFPHVARIVVSPIAAGACVSQSKTLQLIAQAFDANNNMIPTAGSSYTWVVGDASLVSVDANGVATAKRPGKVQINASLVGTMGLPILFTTCPPALITIGTQNVTPIETAFTLAAGGSKTLAAGVTDTNGNPITDLQLTFTSSNNGIASAPNTASTSLTANVTAVSPGTTTIIASCTPPSCNPGVNQPYYSNPVTVTVSGSSSTKVLVTGTTASGVVIIDSNNAPGAPVAFPAVNGKTPLPNSVVISPDGAIAYIGTDQGLARFDLNANTFLSTLTSFPLLVLSVSQNGSKVVASDVAGTVFVFDIPSVTVQLFSRSGVAHADYSTDNLDALMFTGSTLVTYGTNATALGNTALANPGSDIRFFTQSSVALVAENGTSELIANCSRTPVPSSPGNVGSILAKPNTPNRLWGADGNNIYQADLSGTFATTSTTDCRPDVTVNSTPRALGAAVTPLQLAAAPDGQKAYLVNSSSKLFAANTSGVTPITLAGGATPLSASVTPDSASVYVGASDNVVHRVDAASNTDVQQINPGLKKSDGTAAAPDLVAVRTK